jgi:hypothetical protein
MNREQIIERTWNTPELLGITRKHLEKSLEGVGFFDLLAAAMVYHIQENPNAGNFQMIGKCSKCGGRTPSISMYFCKKCAWEKLDAAIAKITGDTP